ncbi:MAG: hypothetical protein ABI688_07990 [Bacteroidota bacterium]
MNKTKKGFWKNITRKKVLLIAGCVFITTLLVGCGENYLSKVPVPALFTGTALLHRAFEALFVGIILSGLITTKNISDP